VWLVQDHRPAEERAVAEKLSRAISIVDADVFRLTGKRHRWSSQSLNPDPRPVLTIKRPRSDGATSVPIDNNLNPNAPMDKEQ
jgi:hypothetical protein